MRARFRLLTGLVGLGAIISLANCGAKTVIGPEGVVVTPLHATGQTATDPPTIIDLTVTPGTASGGRQPIIGSFTGTTVGSAVGWLCGQAPLTE